jgi:hypothetical protein
LLLAFTAAQMAPRWPRLTWSMLLASAMLLAALAAGQWLWVLPRMTDMASELGLGGLEPAFRQRIAGGGVYATMTIANALAAACVLLLPAVVASTWLARRSAPDGRGRRWRARQILGAVVAVVLLGTLLLSGAKGALASAVGAAVIVLARWGRWRSALALLGITAAGGALLWSAVSEGIAASWSVRLGYWQAGWSVIAEQPLLGTGLGNLPDHLNRHLAIGDEFSRHLHNEPLHTWAVGGLPAGMAVLLLLGWWLLRRGYASAPLTSSEPIGLDRRLGWALPVALPALLLMGSLLSDNLAWWPGVDPQRDGASGPSLAWATALGVLALVVVQVGIWLPPPPRWAIHAGLAALALGCLLDFHLHEHALVALAVILAGLRGSSRTWTPPPWARGLFATLLLATAAGLVLSNLRHAQRAAAHDELALLRQAQSRPEPAVWAELAERAGEELLSGSLPSTARADRICQRLATNALDQALAWPADRSLALAAQAALPARDRLAALGRLTHTLRDSHAVQEAQAQTYADRSDWSRALTIQRQLVSERPQDLRQRRRLADWLDAAGLTEEAMRQRVEAERLQPRLHPSLRTAQ